MHFGKLPQSATLPTLNRLYDQIRGILKAINNYVVSSLACASSLGESPNFPAKLITNNWKCRPALIRMCQNTGPHNLCSFCSSFLCQCEKGKSARTHTVCCRAADLRAHGDEVPQLLALWQLSHEKGQLGLSCQCETQEGVVSRHTRKEHERL